MRSDYSVRTSQRTAPIVPITVIDLVTTLDLSGLKELLLSDMRCK